MSEMNISDLVYVPGICCKCLEICQVHWMEGVCQSCSNKLGESMENTLCAPHEPKQLNEIIKELYFASLDMLKRAEPGSAEMEFGKEMIRIYEDYGQNRN